MRMKTSPWIQWSLLCTALFLLPSCRAPQANFPGEHWEIVAKPEKLGYDSAKLAEAKEFAGTINTAAVAYCTTGADHQCAAAEEAFWFSSLSTASNNCCWACRQSGSANVASFRQSAALSTFFIRSA